MIRERFAPRLLGAPPDSLTDEAGHLDPFRAWDVMMTGEKPGGHGERCVAVGALDTAIWDAAAKIAELPLYRFLAARLGRQTTDAMRVRVYAGGGYPYPHEDLRQLSEEMQRFADLGYTHAKLKLGHGDLSQDLRRIEAAASQLTDASHLAVDAMNRYDLEHGCAAATELRQFNLWWFEDVCDPLEFDTQARIAALYGPPLAAGEALFSSAEARLLDQHGGLRRDRDVLVFDPIHCYGVPGYLRILETLTARGWPRQAFWPHGGHLFSVHLVAALGLGGAEVNPLAFHPFSGLTDGARVESGTVRLPQGPGTGFELHQDVWRAFQNVF